MLELEYCPTNRTVLERDFELLKECKIKPINKMGLNQLNKKICDNMDVNPLLK